MRFLLELVSVVVLGADPFMWIGPVIAAFFSRGRLALVPAVGLVWAAVLELSLIWVAPEYDHREFINRCVAGILVGLIIAGIAALVHKRTGARRAAGANQKSGASD